MCWGICGQDLSAVVLLLEADAEAAEDDHELPKMFPNVSSGIVTVRCPSQLA